MSTIHNQFASGFTIMQFNGEDSEIGRLWSEHGQLKFEGNASDAARQLFDQLIKRNSEFLSELLAQNDELHGQLLAMEHDRDKWQNHHHTEVARSRCLKNRTDLPVERKMLYEALRLAELAAGTASLHPAEHVVTSVESLDKVLAVYHAAERLVRCKGRYHSEQNYKALAELFGVSTPDLEPLPEDGVTYLSEEGWNHLQELIDAPPAPSQELIDLMSRKPRYIVREAATQPEKTEE